jgi:hypothetical protein
MDSRHDEQCLGLPSSKVVTDRASAQNGESGILKARCPDHRGFIRQRNQAPSRTGDLRRSAP